MKRFILSPRANQDINDIWDYIADDNIEAADRVLDALDNAPLQIIRVLHSARDVRSILGLTPDEP